MWGSEPLIGSSLQSDPAIDGLAIFETEGPGEGLRPLMRQQAEAVWLGTPSALLRCIGAWGHSRMRTAEKYRRFGQECVELARTAKSPANKAVLLHMAQVWFRLAEEHAAHAAETIED